MPDKLLIACLGNIFMGDDAFGVEVARRLSDRAMPKGARVVDFGIRGLDLTYALLDGCEAAILVDAAPHGYAPGTLFVLEPEMPAPACAGTAADAMGGDLLIEGHSMDPVKVLRVVAAMGGHLSRLLLVGCEPTPLDEYDEMDMGLSPAVRRAVDEALPLIESLASDVLSSLQTVPTSHPVV